MAKRCNKHRAVVGSSPTRCKKSCQAIIPVNEEEVENRFIHRQLPSSLAAYSVLRHKGAPPAVSLDIVEERRRPTFASPTHKDSGQPEKAQAARHKWVIEKEPPAADSRSLRSRGGGGRQERTERVSSYRGAGSGSRAPRGSSGEQKQTKISGQKRQPPPPPPPPPPSSSLKR